MKSMFWRPVSLAILLGLLVASIKVLVGWWHGELSLADDGNWLWLALFPVLLIVWWRNFSIFGCKEPNCLLPKDEER
ncbi:MAG: hypothetical protein OEV23_00525 [Gallionella sp.]|nr:hypothetical protein [Gallionella sp.]